MSRQETVVVSWQHHLTKSHRSVMPSLDQSVPVVNQNLSEGSQSLCNNQVRSVWSMLNASSIPLKTWKTTSTIVFISSNHYFTMVVVDLAPTWTWWYKSNRKSSSNRRCKNGANCQLTSTRKSGTQRASIQSRVLSWNARCATTHSIPTAHSLPRSAGTSRKSWSPSSSSSQKILVFASIAAERHLSCTTYLKRISSMWLRLRQTPIMMTMST